MGLVDVPSNNTLKPDAELENQRVTKFPEHFREKKQKGLAGKEQN